MGVEFALPLGLAWLLQKRKRKGQKKAGTKTAGATSDVAAASLPPRTHVQRATAAEEEPANSSRELRQLQWKLLHLALLQLAIRSGLWKRVLNRTAVNLVHKLSTRGLKKVLYPLAWCFRPLLRRRERLHAIAAPAAAAAAVAAAADPAPAATAQTPTALQNSPQSGSDMEELEGHVPARPAHIVIISRPQPLCSGSSSSAAGTSAPGDAAAPLHRQVVDHSGEPSSNSCWVLVPMTPSVSLAAWHAGGSEPTLTEQLQQQPLERQLEQERLLEQEQDVAAGPSGNTSSPDAEAQSDAEPGVGGTPTDLGSTGEIPSEVQAELEAGSGVEARAEFDAVSEPSGIGSKDVCNESHACTSVAQLPSTPAPPLEHAQPSPSSAPASEDPQPLPSPTSAPEHSQPLPPTASCSSRAPCRPWDPALDHPTLHVLARLNALHSAAAAQPHLPPAVLDHGAAASQLGPTAPDVQPVGALALESGPGAPRTEEEEEGEGAAAAPCAAPSGATLPFLDLPLCASATVLHALDTDAHRVLRGVSRGMYFEASRHLTHLTVQQDNLETLVYMPMHLVFPALRCLSFVSGVPASLGSEESLQLGQPLPPLSTALLQKLFRGSLPHLRELREVDLTEACFHTSPQLWDDFASGLPRSAPVMVRLREPSAWWARGLTVGLPGDGRDLRDHFPPLLESLRALQRLAPAACVDLQGVTVRRHTATRLPQLCHLASLRHLALFGKSAVAVPHGHRLASHLHAFVSMSRLVSLELLSYEDVSDSELAVLSDCASLRHLYVDSLFIKMASGPVFPNITSLATARIKFILQPLTTIFPNLSRLRLGVLHSELNKKINSTSVSCLAGCSEKLQQLVVCPILWKGQWQVLPTLLGMRRLSLVHCRDLSHLREVLVVVGRSPSLELLELQACSASVAPWPGVVAMGPGAALGMDPGLGADALADAGDASGTDTQVLGPLSESRNLFAGLSGCESLRELVVHDCAPVLVRHLAAAQLPGLRTLRLQKMGAMRLPDVQAAVLNLQALSSLHIEDSPSLSAAQAHQLPASLSRPSLSVSWSSSCRQPSLYTTRGFGLQEL